MCTSQQRTTSLPRRRKEIYSNLSHRGFMLQVNLRHAFKMAYERSR